MNFEDAATESRLQAQKQVEQLADLHADRLKIYDHFTDIVNKFKSAKVCFFMFFKHVVKFR